MMITPPASSPEVACGDLKKSLHGLFVSIDAQGLSSVQRLKIKKGNRSFLFLFWCPGLDSNQHAFKGAAV